MALQRRVFLKVGLGGAAALALGGLGLGLRPTVYVPMKGELICLNERQYAVLSAMADCIVSPTPDMPSVEDLNVVQAIDGMLSDLHPEDTRQLLQAVGLLENALSGLLWDGRIHTFTGSSRLGRVQILDGWRHSRLSVKKQAYLALHQLCVAAYWGHPEAYRFTDYPGPPDFSGLVPTESVDG